MVHVPIIRVADTLIATVQDELLDSDMLALQEDLAATLERSGVGGVLIDLSAAATVDSFLGRLLSDIATGARLMGANTVVVGIQPAVAISLVELGLDLKGVHTALNPERGLAWLLKMNDNRSGSNGRGQH
ncbi:MAG: anti-anti-sigma factor [Chloroflexi bacterium]|nr:anti-anti-sigma factor [Chloroflexota bacterium]